MDPTRIEKKLDFDLDFLLVPIPAIPAEESSQSEAYDRVRDARSRAAWAEAADLCVQDLRNGPRDLQFAAWLAEAWLHLYGFNGLAHGLEAIADICESHWGESPVGESHPADANHDSFADHLTSIAWVNENVPAMAGSLFQEQLQQGALPADKSVYEDLLSDLESASDTAGELEAVLNAHCGERAPRLEELMAMLGSMREQVESILGRREPETTDPPVEDSIATDIEAPVSQLVPDDSGFRAGPIRNRNDAFKLLAEAADFLTRTDPHSPVPLLVRRAIAWGDMPLGDLIADMIRHDGDRTEINRLLGVNKPGKQ